ncbi:ECF-type sigma factor [Limnoglobus roseus]|uniref:RNA polymerase subunit sigma-70 n=1 Tax=Limnoglobus roseus TaxID=2598579 RepID=A0A5C1AS46_9BACT|nr:ECF-type sigma factor [Limnoglobus roseus]QEL20856.1 RNA polymerase subunit sigma-70 [Limnoglobus roseus]
MADEGSITTWINRLSAGESDAASPIWDRYFQRMVSLAVGRLPGLKADAEDVALSAFFQFCRAATENRFAKLASRDDLWHLLVVLTARKAVDWRKWQTAQKRSGPTQAISDDVADRTTDPALAAVVTDEIRGMFEKLDDDDLRTIARLKLEGHTNEEIATRLNCTTRTVMRRLALIRDIWEADAVVSPSPE